MPPNIYFDHSSTYLNTGLMPSGPFEVGRSTDIGISLLNDGNQDGVADVHLYWWGPTAGFTDGTQLDLLPLLDPPVDPIIFTVAAAAAVGGPPGAGSKTVGWTPRASDFPNTLGTGIHGCLFAQAVIQSIAPDYDGDTSALGNWTPTYPLCAQHNIDIITIPPPPPSPKPIRYAFGAGHSLPGAVQSKLVTETIPGDDPALIAYVEPRRSRLRVPKAGRALGAADVGLTLGVERLWVPRTKGAGLRLGHTGPLAANMVEKLTASKRAKSLSLAMEAGELRQAIVDITPPKGAKRGDYFAVGIANMGMPTASRSVKPRLLGTLTLIVLIA